MLVFGVLTVLFPLRKAISYATVVTASDGKVLHAFLSSDEKWRMESTLDEISPQLIKAILQKEDKYFYYHLGVNPIAVLRAGFKNILYRKKTSGASTITMQVARLLYPQKRTLLNKIVESFRAFQLEVNYSKKEILALYLNLIPYGGNIEGAKAASVFYFGKLPSALSLAECVTLCIVPNRPNSLRPGRNNGTLKQERNKWLKHFGEQKVFQPAEISDALNEPVEIKRLKAPAEIPQLAYRMRKQYPEQNNISLALNSAMQYKVQALAFNYSKRLALKNIFNSAVLVVDNRTRKVIAYVGSNDKNDLLHNGFVDGVNAVRSPGSTLKPLAYALAIDKGLLTPKTMINDVPVNYMGYMPENFNSRFGGSVSVEFALTHSLNIPAVKTVNNMGLPTFIDALSRMDFTQIIADKKKLGLSVVLGGCGVKLSELTNLYCAFANNGYYKPLLFLEADTSQTERLVVSPAAAYLITEMLSKIVRPDMPNNYESSLRIPKVAWKTGTSYGRRDAWSIGYNTNYTIGVWVGNFNGDGIAELTGSDMATPLLFDIFNSIDYNAEGKWFRQPDEVNYRLVCSESGNCPASFCDKQVMDEFIPGISNNRLCTHMKEVMLSPDASVSYCTSCVPPTGYKRKLFPNPEPELLAFYQSEHVNIQTPPQHNPACTRIFKNTPPKITSPVDKSEYIIDTKNGDKLLLSCQTSGDVQTVYWYINDIFFRASNSTEQLFFIPEKGTNKISCADDKGQNSNVWITVNE
jgi:penicillin-binding protein 1C